MAELWDPATLTAVATLFVTAVGVGIQLRRRGVERRRPSRLQRTVLLLNVRGDPLLDVFVLSPDGEDLQPDERGTVAVSLADADRTFCVLERATRRKLCDFRFSRCADLLSVEVPR